MPDLIDKKKLLKAVLDEYADGNFYIMHLIRDFPAAGKEENMIEWRTDIPDTKDEVMVTCQSGSARWVLPGCTYDPKNRAWYHTIIEEHDVEISPDGDTERVWNKEERIMADVIAWAEYPEPYGGEA